MAILPHMRTRGRPVSLVVSGVVRRVVRRRSWPGLLVALVATSASAQDSTRAAPAVPPSHTDQAWPIKTREHVDLWLHGFAMVEDDSAQVPLFRRGYRDDLTVTKNKANVLTKLDTNHDQLHARFAVNHNLMGAQFLAIETGSWEELRQIVTVFLKANGDPNRAPSRQVAPVIAHVATYFPAAGDRAWLQLFVTSLDDEREHFYHTYWTEQQRQRRAVLTAVDSLWQHGYRPKMQRFLNNTQQPTGDLLLSLPIGGEGRTVQASKHNNVIAVEFPDSIAHATEAIYVFAHEAMGAVAAAAITDNITPAQRRAGLGAHYESAATVRGGLMLLERTAPDLVDGYCRYYLAAANIPFSAPGDGRDGRAEARPYNDHNPGTTTGAPAKAAAISAAPSTAKAALEAAFPLPDLLRDALAKQLDVVIGGI